MSQCCPICLELLFESHCEECVARVERFWSLVCERANEIRRNRPERGEWDVIPYGQAATEILAEMRRAAE